MGERNKNQNTSLNSNGLVNNLWQKITKKVCVEGVHSGNKKNWIVLHIGLLFIGHQIGVIGYFM